jgi:aldose 1-dehydrogenase [NAD(P)+]
VKALGIRQGEPGAKLIDVPQPSEIADNQVLLRTLYTGICGTDRGIISGQLKFARPPQGSDFLIMGHEGLAQVQEVGKKVRKVKPGDLVVPMVRRPGGCLQCRIGRQDNCEDGDFVEAGIRGKDGFMREYFIDEERFLVNVYDKSLGRLAVLTEPLKNVVKSFDAFRTVSRRSIAQCDDGSYDCRRVTVAGGGPIGLLFGMLFRSYGFDVQMFDRNDHLGKLSEISEKLGIDFMISDGSGLPPNFMENVNVFVDTTGSAAVVGRGLESLAHNGCMILFGTSTGGGYQLTGDAITSLVERNVTIMGTVDGSKSHYIEALNYLSAWSVMFPGVLEDIITQEAGPEDSIAALNTKVTGEIKRIIKW